MLQESCELYRWIQGLRISHSAWHHPALIGSQTAFSKTFESCVNQSALSSAMDLPSLLMPVHTFYHINLVFVYRKNCRYDRHCQVQITASYIDVAERPKKQKFIKYHKLYLDLKIWNAV